MAGEGLLAAARAGVQLVDGGLAASLGDDVPWVIVRAVDSTEWDIESDDTALLERLTGAILTAQPLPD